MTLRASVTTTSMLLAAALALTAPAALAQGTAAKPAAKPAAKADAKKAAEDADKKKADDAKADEDADKQKGEEAAKVGPPATASEPPAEEWNVKDVAEIDGKRYLFVGARYRGNIIPKFMLNLFVDEGATIYSNTIAVELDMRKDGFSLIPALGFTEYGTSDILFKQKGEKDIPGNYSFVNSSMKAIYATVDLLWSAKISKNFDFEYGAGFGLGAIFGDLANNWVYQDDVNGALSASNGHKYAKCQTGGTQPGCNALEHKNTDTLKVGNYTEPSWFSGGSKPVVFPWISIPQLGLRYKPVKNFVARLGMGFALTGFWFGLNGEYGLEQKPKP
jgi:hypothetical protein